MQILFPTTMLSSLEKDMDKNLTHYFKKYIPNLKTISITDYRLGKYNTDEIKQIISSWNSDILQNLRKAIREFEDAENLGHGAAHKLRVAVDGTDGVWSPLSQFVFLWPNPDNLAPEPKTVMQWNQVDEFFRHAEYYTVAFGNFILND